MPRAESGHVGSGTEITGVHTPPKTCQCAVSVTTPGHWGEVSVLPRGLDKQALGKFPLEAEAKDLG